MEMKDIIPIFTFLGAVVSSIVSLYISYKSRETSEKSRIETERFTNQLEVFKSEQQRYLVELKSHFDGITYVLNSQYSKKVEVLSKIYADLAVVKLHMQNLVVPFFASNSETREKDVLRREMEERFLQLYEFCLTNEIFISKEINIWHVLRKMLTSINKMNSLKDKNDWTKQAKIMIDDINPLMEKICKQVREELQLS